MPDPTGIFISYRRIDTNWAAVSLKHHIARHLPGAPVFMDIESIEPGQDFVEAINHNVDQCRILLAVIGPNWLTVSDNAGRRRLDNPDDFVRLEITRALDRRIRLIPLLVDNATMPPGDVMPDPLKPLSRCYAVTVNYPSHTRDFDVVTEFLDKAFPDLASARTAAPAPVAATPPPPPHDIGAEIAQALLDAGTDPKTMLSVAQMRHEAGQHRI
ncbi:MAG: toll/interleukin-1 receptor domain-containing protein, partial [Rhodobacteraceae bacterium]|nr:toll/interleukin-1 receptor domain-containing protein [Paracoccaceae bacterium]